MSLSWKKVHHRVTEGTESGIIFFVYREIPIDEKVLSDRSHDTALIKRIPVCREQASVFFHEVQSMRFLGHNLSVCRYLPTNRNFSLCPPCLCGDKSDFDWVESDGFLEFS